MKLIDKAKYNLGVYLWALKNVPMLAWIGSRVEKLDESETVVSIPLSRRQKNHLGSMYFGSLACGADLAGGLIAFKLIQEKNIPLSFVFKDFKAEFLKRPEARTYFTCKDGDKIQSLVDQAMKSGLRVNDTVKVVATCPEKLGDEPVAKFELTISLKKRS